MKQKEINLLDLFVELLLGWRSVVAIALAAAIAAAGISYVSSARAAAAAEQKWNNLQVQLQAAQDQINHAGDGSQDQLSVDEAWLRSEMTDKEQNAVADVINYEKQIHAYETYLKQSLLMQLDPMNIVKGELTFRIAAEDSERTYDIQKVYEDLFTGGSFRSYMAAEYDVSEAAIAEVISLEQTSYGQREGNDTVRLYIYWSDKEGCKDLMQSVLEYADVQSAHLAEGLGAHQLILLSQSDITVMDMALYEKQRSYNNTVLTWKNTVSNLKNEFTSLQEGLYAVLAKGSENVTVSEEPEGENVSSEILQSASEAVQALQKEMDSLKAVKAGVSLSHVLLGIIFAGFVYIFVVCVKYMMNDKLRPDDDVRFLYQIESFGTIVCKEEKKKPFAAVDRWILSLRSRNKRKFTAQEAVRLAAVSVKMAAGKEGARKVYLIGSNLGKDGALVCSQIKDIVEKQGVSVEVLDQILYDAENMGKLEGAQCAVLVEVAGTALYKEILQEKELLKRQNIALLGCVVVG